MAAWRAIYALLPAETRQRLRALAPADLRRWLAHARSDAYLVSYPKCGRTWLRLMLGRAVAQHYGLGESEEVLFWRTNQRLHPRLPRLTVVHEDHPMYKTPAELQTDKRRFHNKKVIFLARDPRDVIVSHYFEMTNRGRLFGENPYEKHAGGFEGSLPEFIHAERGGFATLLAYYNLWAANRQVPSGFLLLRYEDLKRRPAGEVRRALDFLGAAAISSDEIDEAVAFSSFENMRKMEAEGRFNSGLLRPGDQKNQESFKTRKGKVRGFVDYLAPQEIAWLNQTMLAVLDPYFGYAVDESLREE